MFVVEQHRAWAKKNAGFEVEAVEYRDSVLQLAEITDPHTLVDVDALPKDAALADHRALAHLCLMPDAGARADSCLI